MVDAPTETAAEGGNAKYMSALNIIVALVPAREHVFVLTDANARTWKRGEGSGEIDSKAQVPMVEMCSTKTANYCFASQKAINSLF